MSLKKRMPERACSVTGVRELAGPTDPELGLAYIHLGTVCMEDGEDRGFNFGPLETVVVIMAGTAEVVWEGENGVERRERIGGRRDVFDGPPWAFFAHPFTTFGVRALSPFVEMVLVRAEPPEPGPGFDRLGGVEIVSPDGVVCKKAGKKEWERTVSLIVGPETPVGARRLVVGESIALQGSWLAYPGHKHDEDVVGEEARLEEVYHFRFRPQRGFGIARVYSPVRRFDQANTVEDGDTLAVPFGYHTVAAAPGYDMYCLWALAGEQRKMLSREDERHAWVHNIQG
ncbi:MAG: 5-deoxy-glucuronate isomerase [Firmicutes bacterium]|nr:5-deoxy-glucuronate isomerase [Bacillota bacterium]